MKQEMLEHTVLYIAVILNLILGQDMMLYVYGYVSRLFLHKGKTSKPDKIRKTRKK